MSNDNTIRFPVRFKSDDGETAYTTVLYLVEEEQPQNSTFIFFACQPESPENTGFLDDQETPTPVLTVLEQLFEEDELDLNVDESTHAIMCGLRTPAQTIQYVTQKLEGAGAVKFVRED